MHNTLTRLQNVFGFFTSVATAVAAVIAVTSLLATPVPQLKDGSLKLSNVQVTKGRTHYYTNKVEEYAHIKFDLDIDLSSLFTWNTKQIFLYITASYPPKTTRVGPQPDSKAIIWDAILPHPLAQWHHNYHIYPGNTLKQPRSIKSSPPKKLATNPTKPGILKLSGHRPKYQITDPSGAIAGRPNATLELNWNAQPWVGALTWVSGSNRARLGGFAGERGAWWTTWRKGGARSATFDLPALKNRTEAAKAAGGGLDTEKGKEQNRGSPS